MYHSAYHDLLLWHFMAWPASQKQHPISLCCIYSDYHQALHLTCGSGAVSHAKGHHGVGTHGPDVRFSMDPED